MRDLLVAEDERHHDLFDELRKQDTSVLLPNSVEAVAGIGVPVKARRFQAT